MYSYTRDKSRRGSFLENILGKHWRAIRLDKGFCLLSPRGTVYFSSVPLCLVRVLFMPFAPHPVSCVVYLAAYSRSSAVLLLKSFYACAMFFTHYLVSCLFKWNKQQGTRRDYLLYRLPAADARVWKKCAIAIIVCSVNSSDDEFLWCKIWASSVQRKVLLYTNCLISCVCRYCLHSIAFVNALCVSLVILHMFSEHSYIYKRV